MKDRGALSLLRGAGRASGRFVAEVAVSFIATLCVTLVLSGWFRPGAASGGAEVVPAGAVTPAAVSSSPVANPLASAGVGAQVKTTAVEASANLPILVEKDVAEKEKLASAHALEPVSVISASSPHPRSSSHATKTPPHNAQASCVPACAGHASTEAGARVANLEPPLRLAGVDLQNAAPASIAEEDHRASVFGLALPAVPVHGVFTRPWRPVLQGASSVTELITGLAGKP